MVEQLTLNQWVGGSSPPGCTITNKDLQVSACKSLLFLWLRWVHSIVYRLSVSAKYILCFYEIPCFRKQKSGHRRLRECRQTWRIEGKKMAEKQRVQMVSQAVIAAGDCIVKPEYTFFSTKFHCGSSGSFHEELTDCQGLCIFCTCYHSSFFSDNLILTGLQRFFFFVATLAHLPQR